MKKLLVALGLAASGLVHAELIQQFKDPAFNGQGWTSHVLTIDNIEKTRRDAIESEKKAALAKALSDAENTPLNRFLSLFQSQVYAQLATQLGNNLFQNKCASSDGGTIPGCTQPNTGNFSLDGNTISYVKTATDVILTVVDLKGNTTVVKVPIASFAF